MSKESTTWHSQRVQTDITLVRWGEVGTPILVFPTAGGDCEEIERFHLIGCVAEQLAEGRIKIYSVDSLAGGAWFTDARSKAAGAAYQNRFDECLYHEVVPAIRKDCQDESVEIITAGASIGAYNALAFLARHPDVCAAAICMSGTYGLEKFLNGAENPDFIACSPHLFVPELPEDHWHIDQLRQRFVLLTHGEGANEDPAESWRVAHALGARGVPNRVDGWGKEYPHDWTTWREMFPGYVDELVPRSDG